jgi:hypothetical protein
MPFVFGAALGWLMFHPPGWLSALGPLAWLVNLMFCALMLVSVVPLIALANLPSDLKLEPVSETEVPSELGSLRSQLVRSGFRPAGPPLRVHVKPAAILLGFVHEKDPVYATIFRTTTLPAKTGYDMVSVLYGDKGGLTTGADPAGATLPAGSGSFRQVIKGAGIDALFQAHVDGIAFLREKGIQVRPVSEGTFQQDLKAGVRHQREVFLASPIRNSIMTLLRAGTKQVPFIGRLREQAAAQQQVTCFLSGQHQRAF